MLPDDPRPANRDPWIGRRLGLEGRYRLERRLGEGGFGTAYLAHDLHVAATTGETRAVVVKLPHAERSRDGTEGLPGDFVKEASALTRLHHAHVLKVIDVGTDGVEKTPYLVLEFAAGGSLDDVLARAPGPQSLDEVLRWLPDVARALDYIHGRGVLHRDVKPSNILFDEGGAALLADFGIVKVFGSTSKTGHLPGSPLYMGPEAMLARDLDGRYDQYALAATAYEALCGRHPIEPEEWADGGARAVTPITAQRLLYRKTTEAPVPLRTRNPTAPLAVSAVLDRALATDRDARFPSCSAFAEAVREASMPPAPTTSSAPLPELDSPSSMPPRQRRVLRGVVVVAIVAATAWLAWSFLGGPSGPTSPGDAAPTSSARALTLDAPVDGAIVGASRVHVSGQATAPPGTPLAVAGVLVDRSVAGRFESSVAASRDGPTTIEVVLGRTDDPARLAVTRRFVVDTTPPTVEVLAPQGDAFEVSASSAAVRVRARVTDAHPKELLVDGRVVQVGSDGVGETSVALEEGERRSVEVVAVDGAGHRSAPEILALRRGTAPPVLRGDAELAEAASLALAGDIDGAKAAWARAKAKGKSDADAGSLLKAFADYDAAPVVEWTAPLDGFETKETSVRVRGVLSKGRATDEVTVQGATVRTGPGGFDVDVPLPTEGASAMTVGVVDRGAPRGAPLVRTVRRVPSSPWSAAVRAFLAGWAEPVGDAKDEVTGFPKRVRRTTDGGEMVLVPGGSFWMAKVVRQPASPHAGAAPTPGYVRVTLPRAYYLDVHEVSVAQFAQFALAKGFVTDLERQGGGMWNAGGPSSWSRAGEYAITWRTPWPPDVAKSAPIRDELRHPVIKVTWADAMAYCGWAGVTLPTEAQFERALRAGRDRTRFPWGDTPYPPTVVENLRDASHVRFLRANGTDPSVELEPGESAVTYDDGFALTAPVASFPANAFGVHDLAGNVLEWCLDVLDPESQLATGGPSGRLDGVLRDGKIWRFLRGGDWGWSEPDCAGRAEGEGEGWTQGVGFRCARTLPSGLGDDAPRGRIDVPGADGLIEGVDWPAIGAAIRELTPTLGRMVEEIEAKAPPGSETIAAMQRSNDVLVKEILGVVRRLGRSAEETNEVFTHPAFAANAMIAALEVGGLPATKVQRGALATLAADATAEEARRLATRATRTIGLARVIEASEVRERFYAAALALLSDAQRVALVAPKAKGRLQVDLFSPALLWAARARGVPVRGDGDGAPEAAEVLLSTFGWTPERRGAVRRALAGWADPGALETAPQEGDPLIERGHFKLDDVLRAARQHVIVLQKLETDFAADAEALRAIRGMSTVMVPVRPK